MVQALEQMYVKLIFTCRVVKPLYLGGKRNSYLERHIHFHISKPWKRHPHRCSEKSPWTFKQTVHTTLWAFDCFHIIRVLILCRE